MVDEEKLQEEDERLHDSLLFPVINPEPSSTECEFLSLEEVLEIVHKKLRSGKHRYMMQEEPGDVEEEIVVESDLEDKKGKDLYPGVSGVSNRIIEMFWQVSERFKEYMQKEAAKKWTTTKGVPVEEGIKAKQYVIGAMLRTGLIPFEKLLSGRPSVLSRRLKALDNDDSVYLAKFAGKKFELIDYFSEKHSTSYRIGYLSGFDKKRLFGIRDAYNWYIGDLVNIILIYGVACSISLLPWNTVVKRARIQILGFGEWFDDNYGKEDERGKNSV